GPGPGNMIRDTVPVDVEFHAVGGIGQREAVACHVDQYGRVDAGAAAAAVREIAKGAARVGIGEPILRLGSTIVEHRKAMTRARVRRQKPACMCFLSLYPLT